MLVLTRRASEAVITNQNSLVINENIEIIVLSINKSQVILGINAPPEIPIYCKEYMEKRKAKMEARIAAEVKNHETQTDPHQSA